MAEETVIDTQETGPAAVETVDSSATVGNPETQISEGPNHQPDSGVPAEVLNGVPQEPDNVQKVDTDGSLNSSIDGKVPSELNSKAEWLHNILDKERANPEIDFSEDELDILDEYYEGRLKPTEPAGKKEEQDPDAEAEKPGADTDKSNDDTSIEAVLKEVGAKNQDELLGKIKDLRKVVTGKVKGSPEFKKLQSQSNDVTKRLQNEFNLMEDVQKGIPMAIQHFENTYGVKIQRPGETPEKQETSRAESESDSGEYLDDFAEKQINVLKKEIKELTGSVKDLKANSDKTEEKFAGERAESSIIDEMVQIGERVPILKEISNLRTAIKNWRGGKDDTRLDPFQKLFEIANEKSVDLVTAYEILAGRSAQFDVAKARTEGKRAAYNQKPNRSLSDLQGRGVDNKSSYTKEQVENMINENRIPEEWFDANDNPNQKVIPKQFHDQFFHPSELR